MSAPPVLAWLQLGPGPGVVLKFDGGCGVPFGALPVKDKEELQRTLGEVCSGAPQPCFRALVVQPAADGDFGALATWLAAALSSPSVRESHPAVVAGADGKVLPPLGFSLSASPSSSVCSQAALLPPKPSCDTGKLKSEVRVGAVTTTGELDMAKVAAQVTAQKENLLSCYNAARCGDDKLTGRAVVRLTVLSGGQPTKLSSAGSDLPSAAMLDCVVGVLHRTKFPSAAKPTEAIVPILFAPGG